MARKGIVATVGGMIGRRRTARLLGDLSPEQRRDIGLDPRGSVRYRAPRYHEPTQRWLDSLR